MIRQNILRHSSYIALYLYPYKTMGQKILIVDDEPDQEEVIVQAFSRKDFAKKYEFMYAPNGLAALELLKEESKVDIALIDINMPEMDGLALLDHIRKSYPHLQSIIISAYGDMSNIRSAMNKGAFDFVMKPINFKDLEKTLIKTIQYVDEIKQNTQNVHENLLLKQQSMELEMKALRAQMNPHFIFNCINSIDAFILTDDKKNATLYLNKFSKLLRNILDGSRKSVIPLFEEIQTLKLYIQLEELRSNFKFKTIYIIDAGLENSEIEVPSLLLQPVVENAIHHGLRNLTGREGELTIEIRKEHDKIAYKVSDNGIGVKAAKAWRKKESEPLGMEITKSRVKIFNQEQVPSMQMCDHIAQDDGFSTSVAIQLTINDIR